MMLPRSLLVLALCLGAARAAHAQAPAPVNLAAGKPVTQSSTANDGLASRAVDGNTDGDWSHGSIREPDTFDTAARGTTRSSTAASASRPIEVGTKRFGGSSSRGPSFVALAAHGAPP